MLNQVLKIWQVDAFADQIFKGNPAAVIILEKAVDGGFMQNIAMEMNLSETAFVLLCDGQKPLLRWFTPTSEVDLCGHGTLAAAHIYMTEIYPDIKEVVFDTVYAGSLKVLKEDVLYAMSFPLMPGERIAQMNYPNVFVVDYLESSQ